MALTRAARARQQLTLPKTQAKGKKVIYECKACKLPFNNKSAFWQHRQKHDPDRTRYCCGNCKRDCGNKALLRLHNCHTSRDLLSQRLDPDPKFLHCHDCGKSYASQQDYEKHQRGHQGYYCDICHKKYATSSSLSKHRKSVHNPDRESFRCHDCGKSCINQEDYEKHQRRHQGYFCDICHVKYSTLGNLSQHKNRVHNPDRELFRCYDCGKSCANQEQYNQHQKSKHELFYCKKCSQQYKQKHHLTAHIQRKHETKLYPCSKCGRSFLSTASLHGHNSRCGTKRIPCGKCPKFLANKYSRQIHIRNIHKKKMPQCPQCQKKVSSQNMARHIRSHQKTRFYCTCGSNFATREQIQRCEKQHLSRRVPCPICHDMYQESELDVHIHRDHRPVVCEPCYQVGEICDFDASLLCERCKGMGLTCEVHLQGDEISTAELLSHFNRLICMSY